MSDWFTDEHKWDTFMDNAKDWQRKIAWSLYLFSVDHVGESWKTSDLLKVLETEYGCEIKDRYWFLKFAEYASERHRYISRIWGGFKFYEI